MRTANILISVFSLSMLFAASTAVAQVDKRVEVTKDYQPVVSGAVKLPVAPDMADTVKMRPEIDYSITPLMYSTGLVTAHNFKPAAVTYWDFNRPTNFYVKLGVGYPVNTIADLYMSSHNVRTGYIMAAANHIGEFDKRVNWFGDKRNAMRASTRARIAGGVYWGKHMFEGEISYDDEIGRRYAAPASANYLEPDYTIKGIKTENEDFTLKLRLGDDFVDLSRTNFSIGLRGSFFHDKSQWLYDPYKLQQFDFGADGRIGRAFGRNYVEFNAAYDATRGIKDLTRKDNKILAGVRYGYTSNTVDLLAGADYCYDSTNGDAHHNVLPYIKLLLNVTNNDAVIPFVEVEGSVQNNDYFSLVRRTIYTAYDASGIMSSLPNTVNYDLRAGLSGKFGRGRFGYRLYVGLSYAKNALYWYNYSYEWMMAAAARQDELTLNAELDYRPIDELTISAGVHGRFFKDYAEADNGFGLANGKSPVDGYLKLRYNHKKFSIGVSAKVCGASEWSSFEPDANDVMSWRNVRMPAYVDAGVEFDWRIKSDWTLFVEGSNLANMKIYNLAYFREQGIRCTAGFKFVF